MEHQQLMTVRQLPVIEEQLRSAKKQIQQEIKTALLVECTAQTLPAARKARAELNRQFGQLEKRRKEIKRAVLSPYEEFEKIYHREVAALYQKADRELKERIQSVEEVLKQKKRKEFKQYFEEYARREGIPWLSFEDMGYTIGLSDSMPKFRKAARAFIDGIVKDMKAILLQDNSSEILAEYKKTLQLSEAVREVSRRHHAIKEQEAFQTEWNRKKAVEKQTLELSEYLAPPQKVKAKYQLTFTVKATKEELLELKHFLEERGYEYEGANTSAKAEI